MSGPLDVQSNTGCPATDFQFEEAIKITGRRGRLPNVQYRVLFLDRTESWVKTENVGPGLLRDDRLQRRQRSRTGTKASKPTMRPIHHRRLRL